MDKQRKTELIQRSLGLRHKLKVHDSMKNPETHEELSVMLLCKWEFEDELKAIEEVLLESRIKNVAAKKAAIERENDRLDQELQEEMRETANQAPMTAKKKKKPSEAK
ncbi:MAG: hypothetical protein A2583_16615 [Bdellovibrionales bacterium RIFOXYD1_FULL_53_11]|nr:MAG: hypothetical protein A2583_16615 [Bdellovibrionales bacterium RIFOXYD1_FULL_53_11]